MKIRLSHQGNGEAERVIMPDAEEIVDPRLLDWRDDEPKPTLAQRKAIIAGYEEKFSVERHKQQNFEIFLRGGREMLEERAQAENVDASGGYLVPDVFYRQFLANLKMYDQIFDAATFIETVTGGACTIPLDDDANQSATEVSENAASVTTSAVVFDGISFAKTPSWRSGLIRCPRELVDDSAFDLSSLLAKIFATRFARGCGASFTSTLLDAAGDGGTAASSSTVTGDEILSLVDSLDAGFAANAGFLMRQTTLTALKKLKASTGGSYLLPIDRDANGRSRLFGYPIFISPSMGGLTASAKAIAFGALDRFIVRTVRGSLSTRVYAERFAEFYQTAFEAHWRLQGALAATSNGPNPVMVLLMHA